MRRYLPARLLAKDSIISVLSKIKWPGVLPVVNVTSPGIPAFITLDDEALDLGEVIIRELNGEGVVGLLSMENRSKLFRSGNKLLYDLKSIAVAPLMGATALPCAPGRARPTHSDVQVVYRPDRGNCQTDGKGVHREVE